ncbi:MAG: hypothetical protein NTU47_16250 [Ignavibacteriales bacterium]|nr:hypothetical protein [Ignavibacteriales bacterium]
MKKALLLCCVCFAALVGVSAQDKPVEAKKPAENAAAPKPAAGIVPTFGAQFFGNYTYVINGTDGKDYNKFDMERVYFTMKSQIADDWKFQITTDIYRNAAAGSYYAGLAVRLKFAYLDYAPLQGLSVKFGMIPGVWNSTEETAWRYRGIEKTISDKNGYFSTADVGLSATYALPSKLGEVAAYMVNGDGFSAVEANRFKDYSVRATLTPFGSVELLKSFAVSGVASFGAGGTTRALQRDRYGALVGYSYSIFSLGAEYLVRKDAPTNPDTVRTGNVYSLIGEIKAPFADLQSKLSLVVRFDGIEPNVDKGGDQTHYLIAGLVWKVTDKLTLALDNQILFCETNSLKRAPDNVLLDTDRRWFLHTILNF